MQPKQSELELEYGKLLIEGANYYSGKIGKPGHSRANRWIVRLGIRPTVFLARLVHRIEVQGLENISTSQPTIFVSNHELQLDPVLTVSQMHWRPVTAYANYKYFKGLYGLFIRGMGQIPLRQHDAPATDWSNRVGINTLRRRGIIGLYLEGTRARGEICQFKYRILYELLAGCPEAIIVPIGIRHERGRIFGTTYLTFGAEVLPSDYEHSASGVKALVAELRGEVAELAGLPIVERDAVADKAAEREAKKRR